MSNLYLRSMISKGLIKRGWRPVRHAYNGILEKNGLLFVYKMHEISPSPYTDGVLSNTLRGKSPMFAYTKEQTPLLGAHVHIQSFKKHPWHIERYGWVITKGDEDFFGVINYSCDVMQRDGELPENLQQYCEEVFDFIDKFSELTPVELKQYKHREVTFKKTIPVQKTRKLEGTMPSRCLFVNTVEAMADNFPMDYIYSYEKKDSIYLISMYTKDMKGYLYIDSEITEELFNALVEKKVIVPVELYTESVETSNTTWLEGVTGNNVYLPQYILQQKFNINILNAIVKGFTSHVNYIPLLSNTYTVEECEAYLKLLDYVWDVRPLLNKKFNIKQLEIMTVIAKNRYPLDVVADPEYTAEYMTLKHNETLDGLSSLQNMLIESGKTPLQAKAISKVAYRGKGFGHVNRNLSPVMIEFVDYCYTSNLVEIGELIQGHVIDNNDFLMVNYRNVPNEARNVFWERFKLLSPQIFADNKIERFINSVEKKAQILRFSSNYGLFICAGVIDVHLSYNRAMISVNKTFEWSSILVNGKVLTNAEKEDYIMSFL